jgi:ADP-dependent NAD(P)H-hydrate dehydratase
MIRITTLPKLPPRAIDSHKGDFGRALVVGGSRGMSGAVALAGMAALRTGAGRVTLAVPDVCLETVAAFEPSYMTVPLACDDQGRLAPAAGPEILKRAATADAVACGPGLGQASDVTELVTTLYETLGPPSVFDADGLNALSHSFEVLARGAGPRILTPHPGELARLVGSKLADRDEQIDAAHKLSAANQIVVVLKGHETVVTDGKQFAVNTSGNPGMATGGTGDVLTGVITALLCQHLAPFEAAQLGVYVHGLAGDLAAAQLGQVAMIASDLIDFLPAAFLQIRG